ncbi:SpoIID/LytB domain-containing protein [Citricoccus sp.]|uniref:SpoIID/LytB domain-containing protein n=1 Tax=Citricoccus sp. TaxID=1978372 RepID=UPI0028BDA268|nr:SpoIID/LytB domain-containing protein [Citricoccus sp.]
MPVITAPAAVSRPAGPRPARPSGIPRRLLTLLLATVMVLAAGPLSGAAAPAGAATPSTFPDVPAAHTFHEAVTWMIQQEITTGESDGTFGVHEDIRRAEASAFLFRLIDPDVMPPTVSPFPKDVPADPEWYAYTPIAWMATEGIISGYTDRTFRPYRSITRGEMAKILYGVAEADAPQPSEKPFTDVPADSSYAQYIDWMKSEGISQGYAGGTFRPGRPISRGEAAQLIWKVAGEMGYDTTVFPVSFTVTGSGWGHGVGMSQYGARAMAAGGKTSGQILDHYYRPAVVRDGPNRVNENIRVHLVTTKRIAVGGTSKVRVRASGSTSATETTGAVTFTADGDRVVATLPDGTRQSGGSVALEWTGTRFWKGAASTITVPDANGTSTDLVLRHGRVQVTVNGGGELNVVTELRMNDEYLYGVDEMPSLWPGAALEAQTVAGRSYALRNMGSLRSDCDCHVYDDVRSQKFTGWAKENEGAGGVYGARWKAAVEATSQRVLFHNGSVAEATYYSSSGGHTRGAEEQWGNKVPYLTSRPDPYSLQDAANNPNRSWTASLTPAQMARAFGLPHVVTVAETAQNSNSGYTDWITATASDGTTATLTGNQFRSRLGLKSAFITAVTPR